MPGGGGLWLGAGGEGALGRSPGGTAAPPQRPQAAEKRPQGGLGCALRLRFAAAGLGKRWEWPAVACPCRVEGAMVGRRGRGGLWGAAPAARQRRRSGRRPLKTARRAVWAAPYGLRFAAAGIGKYWRSGAAGMGIETIRANFLKSGAKRTGAVL